MAITTFQKKLQNDRNKEETSNAGLKWSQDDDAFLLNNAGVGMKISELAKVLKRTEGSIKTRLIINILNEAKETQVDSSTVGEKYGISKEDISNYEEKKRIREEKKQKKYSYNNSNNYLTDDKVEILQALTQVDKNQTVCLEKLNDLSRILLRIEERLNEQTKKK